MRRLCIWLLQCTLLMLCYCKKSESQTVILQVSDVHDHPVRGAILSAKGNSSTSPPTDIAGKTQLYVSSINPGDDLALVLITPKAPIRILSPWEGRGTVPKLTKVVEVVVGRPGDTAALENSRVVWSLADGVVKTKKACATCANPISGDEALHIVSGEVELDPSQVNDAIRKQVQISPNYDVKHIEVLNEYMKLDPKS